MPISLIAAVAKNNVIGKKNALPWHIPEDLKHFQKITKGKIVLMGQKTFESLGSRPLPGRTNVVVSNDLNFRVLKGVILYNDLAEALKAYFNKELFVVGGASIYAQTIDIAQNLYITHIDKGYEGDAFFPKIEEKDWTKVSEEKHKGFSFCQYRRKRKFYWSFGVAGAILEKNGKILLIKEAKTPIDLGKWSHPAGWIEVGEDPVDAVKKEVLEETGYEFKPTHILGIYSLVKEYAFSLDRGGMPHSIKIIFLGDLNTTRQQPLSDDSAGIKWFTPEEIYKMDSFTLRDLDIKQMVKDYFAGKKYPLDLLTHTLQK